MKGLHQQLAEKRQHLAIENTTATSIHSDPRDAHEAGDRAARLVDEIAKLETDIELGEAAHHQLTIALSNSRTIATGGRELSLAITHAEDAITRLRNHLGQNLGPKA